MVWFGFAVLGWHASRAMTAVGDRFVVVLLMIWLGCIDSSDPCVLASNGINTPLLDRQ